MRFEDDIKRLLGEEEGIRGTEAMRDAKNVSSAMDKKGVGGTGPYAWTDSHLDSYSDLDGEVLLGGYEKSPFLGTFKNVIGNAGTLKDYIEKTLENKKGGIAIEFGGIGINLFKGFSKGFFGKTIGVTLSDYRSNSGQLVGKNILKYDDGREHDIVIGNIFDKSVYKELDKLTKGKKFDLIMERMVAGFRNVPNSPMIIATIFQKWYSLLNEGGLMFVEVPIFLEDVVSEWVKLIKNNYPSTLDIEFDPGEESLRIHKLLGAPEILPMLSVNEIRKILDKDIEINLN